MRGAAAQNERTGRGDARGVRQDVGGDARGGRRWRGGRMQARWTASGVLEMFRWLVGEVCLQRGNVADGCARDRAVKVLVRAAALRAAA